MQPQHVSSLVWGWVIIRLIYRSRLQTWIGSWPKLKRQQNCWERSSCLSARNLSLTGPVWGEWHQLSRRTGQIYVLTHKEHTALFCSVKRGAASHNSLSKKLSRFPERSIFSPLFTQDRDTDYSKKTLVLWMLPYIAPLSQVNWIESEKSQAAAACRPIGQ